MSTRRGGRRGKRRGSPPARERSGLPPGERASAARGSGIAPPIDRRIAIAIPLTLAALTFLVYSPVWRHDFVSFDDPQYVTENAHVTAGLTWAGVRWALTTGAAGNWHPLTWISHMTDVQLFGVNAGPHHVTNLILHVLNSLLLFGVLWRMTGMAGRSAVVAALFAVHPLHVESVAWISERKDVLSTLFWLLALWAYVEYVRRDKWAWYAALVAFLSLGLMSKPMVVTLPCTLLLLDYWPLERPLSKRLFIEKLPLFALAGASSVVTFLAQRRGGAVSALAALPLTSRIENALVAYAGYVQKVIWPASLSPLYPYPRVFGWRPIIALVVLVAITVGAVAAARRGRRYALVGWLWYLGTLVPVIGLVQVGIQSMADRYMYVPSIGLFVIAAWSVPDALHARSWRRPVLAGSAAALILACAVVAHKQVQYWRNSLVLWTHANQASPHDAHVETALGSVLSEQGKAAEAAALYADALQREPQFAEARNKLGVLLADQGRVADAIAQYEAALRAKPSLAEAHYNLGNALARLGNHSGAIAEYDTALQLRPDDAAAHNGLGSALDDAGRLDEAIAQYQEALRLNPRFADAHNNLGAARAKQGRIDDAIAEFLEALKSNPNQADAHYNVGVMLSQRGRTAEAIQHLREALRLKPDHAAARQALQLIGSRAPH